MYVDKILTDVKAVQTLSRLNRCHPKKIDTFVLDFANDEDTIKAAFQRYYKATILSKESDPNKLNDYIQAIEQANIYTEAEVTEVNTRYWNGEDRQKLDPIINIAVERFKALEETEQIQCKGNVKGFLRTYPFIAAVTAYKSVEWEKLYTYFLLLVRKLPKLKDEDFTEGLTEAIDLDQVQVTKMGDAKFALENTDTEIDPVPMGNGAGGKAEPEFTKLSDILEQFNGINWQNKELAKKQLDELPERMKEDEAFVNAAKNSNKATAQVQFNNSMLMIVAKMLNENTEFCRQYLDNPDFMNFINERVFQNVYQQLNTTNSISV